jgi:hypothetical protein
MRRPNCSASFNGRDFQVPNQPLDAKIRPSNHSLPSIRLMKVVAPALRDPPVNLASLALTKMDNKCYHSTQYQEDANQIIEDFGEDHYDDTEDKSDDSPDQCRIGAYTKHGLSPPII